MKRAAIYIRVSSERQAEGVSPEAQEADCRALCDRNGYLVVEVYRDIAKYLVGKRQVEPSGSRADRPGLKAMLAAAREDAFDVIVAWREDRLYRSYRPMLDVLDTLDATKIDIELVKETFDKRIAPVKAWAARMELDAKHDRFAMGVAGRLASGKAWNQPAPYGYSKDGDGNYVENPEESQWIKNLFRWYSEGASYTQIRDRFVAGGAPPRRENNRRVWPVQLLCRYLKAEHYWTGVHRMKWNGTTYEIKLPALVSPEEVQAVKERQAQYKKYPAGNAKHDALAAGIIYCQACGVAMRVTTINNGHTRKDGTRSRWSAYICCNVANRVATPECVQRAPIKDMDAQIWNKLWSLIGEPGSLERAIQERIAQVRTEEAVAEKDASRLERELDDLGVKRQRVIAWALNGRISEDDMSQQLLSMDMQTKALQRDLADVQLLTGDRATRLLQLADSFRVRVQAGLNAINAEPQSEEQAKRQKEYRRGLVQALVKRVWVHPDRTATLELEFDLSETVRINSPAACRS